MGVSVNLAVVKEKHLEALLHPLIFIANDKSPQLKLKFNMSQVVPSRLNIELAGHALYLHETVIKNADRTSTIYVYVLP